SAPCSAALRAFVLAPRVRCPSTRYIPGSSAISARFTAERSGEGLLVACGLIRISTAAARAAQASAAAIATLRRRAAGSGPLDVSFMIDPRCVLRLAHG